MTHPVELATFLAAVAGLFASSEVLRRRGVTADTTRRYTHATGAAMAALLPAFASLGECVALGAGVAAVLVWTRSRGLLASVHGVERPTLGATLLPVGLVLAALIGWEVPPSYILAALVLALADPVAAMAGQVGGPSWGVMRGRKTLAGSLAFFATATAIGFAALVLGAPLSIDCDTRDVDRRHRRRGFARVRAGQPRAAAARGNRLARRARRLACPSGRWAERATAPSQDENPTRPLP